jgi:hypothetical protein
MDGMNTKELCDPEGRQNIDGLEMYLEEEFLGQSVSVDQVGCISHTHWLNAFQVWYEYGKLVFSSEDEENYEFVDLKEVKTWAIDFLSEAVDIIMRNGMVVSVYKN